MGFQWFNTWPYSYSYLPSMDEHIDPVNHTWFEGVNQELYNLEYYLGLQPQGSYKDVAQRLDDMELGAGKYYSDIVVSVGGGNADYDNIQDGLDTLTALGGGRLLIREGTYVITTPLSIGLIHGITIQGMGYKTVIKSGAAITELLALGSAITDSSRIIIRDLTFDGNAEESGSEALVDLLKCDFVTFENCYFLNGKNSAIRLNDCNNLSVINCTFWSCQGHNIDLTNASYRHNVSLNSFHNVPAGKYAIYMQGDRSRFSLNNFTSCDTGILLSGSHNAVVGNTFDTCGIAIRNTNSYNTISSNIINDSTSYSIQLDYKAIVTNNIIHNPGDEGIFVNGGNCYFSIISNNFIYNSGSHGILITNVKEITISGNAIINSNYNGIFFTGVSFCSITGNTIRTNGKEAGTWAGLYLDSLNGNHSTYNQISGNNIEETGNEYGIREADANQNYNNVIGNVVQNAGTTNISLQGANSVKANNIE